MTWWNEVYRSGEEKGTTCCGDLCDSCGVAKCHFCPRFTCVHCGESFEPVAVQEQGEDRVVVKRRLTTGSGRQIAFDYLMTRDDSRWQIVTIITDGVSDLAIKRTQYRRILESEDFDAVIAHIRESIESQRND